VDEDDGGGAGEAASLLGTTAGTSASDLSVALPNCCPDDNNVTQGFMFTQEECDRMKYESPLVKKLRELEVRILFDCMVSAQDGTRKLGMSSFP
jgi:hypothetical protein